MTSACVDLCQVAGLPRDLRGGDPPDQKSFGAWPRALSMGVSYAARMVSCTHLDAVELLEAPAEVRGCEECLKSGTQWVHLRMCQTCGHIGCCDNSPGRHATAHHEAAGHPIIRSVERGEDWSWCYVDELMFRLVAE